IGPQVLEVLEPHAEPHGARAHTARLPLGVAEVAVGRARGMADQRARVADVHPMRHSDSASQNAAAAASPPSSSRLNTPEVPWGKSRAASAESARPGSEGCSTRATPARPCSRDANAAVSALILRMRRSRVSIPTRICWALAAGRAVPKSVTYLARA